MAERSSWVDGRNQMTSLHVRRKGMVKPLLDSRPSVAGYSPLDHVMLGIFLPSVSEVFRRPADL